MDVHTHTLSFFFWDNTQTPVEAPFDAHAPLCSQNIRPKDTGPRRGTRTRRPSVKTTGPEWAQFRWGRACVRPAACNNESKTAISSPTSLLFFLPDPHCLHLVKRLDDSCSQSCHSTSTSIDWQTNRWVLVTPNPRALGASTAAAAISTSQPLHTLPEETAWASSRRSSCRRRCTSCLPIKPLRSEDLPGVADRWLQSQSETSTPQSQLRQRASKGIQW
jgi:hypothetical protein